MVLRKKKGYLRCSTREQADHGISLDAQKSAIEAYAAANGFEIDEWFSDAGYSGGTLNRPGLQALLADALAKGTAIDGIVVFAGSRLFRDAVHAGWYRRKLAANGVDILSATETYSDDPEGELTRRIIEIVDEPQRKKNAVGVQNAMMENARQGFWNGARAPLGYRSDVAEMRGDKEKKHLVVDEADKPLVELIFRLCVYGDSGSGPMGIKSITTFLNDRGFRTKQGALFSKSSIEKVLKNEIYIGIRHWNTKDPETRKARPKADWASGQAPRIISDDLFQQAQMALRARAPSVVAPRITKSDVLLTGLVHCECGERMLLATSTGRKKLYRYYTCAGQLRNNSCTASASTRVSESKLDGLVMSVVADEVLAPPLAEPLIEAVIARRTSGIAEATVSLSQLKSQLAKAKAKLGRVYLGFADGVYDDDDTYRKLKADTKAECDGIAGLIERQERIVAAAPKGLSGDSLRSKLDQMKTKIMTAGIQTQKRFLRAVVTTVVVRKATIEIVGAGANLVDAVSGASLGSLARSEPLVRGSDREWWSRGPSDPTPYPSISVVGAIDPIDLFSPLLRIAP